METSEVSQLKLIGLDLDGTLYPFTPEIQDRVRGKLYQNLALELGISFEKAKESFETNYQGDFQWSNSGSRTVNEMGRQLGRQVNGSDIVQKSLEQSMIADLLKPNPELVEMIVRLFKEREVDLLTGSNYGIALIKLASLNINKNIFTHVLSAEHYGSKSEGELFRYWLGLRDVKPGEILYVGDNTRQDVDAPKRLGIRTCIVGKEYEDADLYIENILGLEKILS